MSESLRRSAHLRCAGELTVALARRFDSERVGEAGAAEEDAEETKEEDWQDGSEEKDGRGRCRRRPAAEFDSESASEPAASLFPVPNLPNLPLLWCRPLPPDENTLPLADEADSDKGDEEEEEESEEEEDPRPAAEGTHWRSFPKARSRGRSVAILK